MIGVIYWGVIEISSNANLLIQLAEFKGQSFWPNRSAYEKKRRQVTVITKEQQI